MTVVIERLQDAADLDGVIEVEAASFHNPTTREWYEGELQRPEVCHIFVLRTAEARVAAFCAFWRVADQIHINNFAVRPELRGRGLGSRLLAEVLAAAGAMGAPRATLEVRRSNAGARKLYERAGFGLVGVRPAYYTNPLEDALVLVRDGAISSA